MQYVVDSSVFVAAFRAQEPLSELCFRFLTLLEANKFSAVIPTSVVLEVTAAIARRTSDAKLARRIGTRLVSFSALRLIGLTVSRMMLYLDLTADLRLAGMDAIVVGTALEFQLPLVTLDKEIQKRAKDVVEIVSIKDYF